MEAKDLKKGKKYYHPTLKIWIKYIQETESLFGDTLYCFTYKSGKNKKVRIMHKEDINKLLTYKDIHYETDYR